MQQKLAYLFTSLALLLFGWVCIDYVPLNFQVLAGLPLFFLLFRRKANEAGGLLLLIAFALVLTAFLLSGLTMFAYFATGILSVYFLNKQRGLNSLLPVWILVAASPALYYVVHIFSFPIRLSISHFGSNLLSFFGMPVNPVGNGFMLPGGKVFFVDDSCVGLTLMGTGLMGCALVLAMAELKHNRSYNYLQILALGLFSFGLLLLANLVRILVLVVFMSGPKQLSHQVLGLMSLVASVWFPLYYVTQFFEPKEGKKFKQFYSLYFGAILVLVMFGSLWFHLKKQALNGIDEKLLHLRLPGYAYSEAQDGVAQFVKDDTLVFIKPLMGALEGGHPPQICWRGAGYELQNFKQVTWQGLSVYYGTLLKQGQPPLHTAWWYENGSMPTHSEWVWRFNKKGGYRVINVSTADSLTLPAAALQLRAQVLKLLYANH